MSLPGPEVAGAEPPARSAIRPSQGGQPVQRTGSSQGLKSTFQALCLLPCPPSRNSSAHGWPGAPRSKASLSPGGRASGGGVSSSCLTPLVFPGQQQRRRQWAQQQPPEQRPLLGGADSPRGWYPSCPGPQRGGWQLCLGTWAVRGV